MVSDFWGYIAKGIMVSPLFSLGTLTLGKASRHGVGTFKHHSGKAHEWRN